MKHQTKLSLKKLLLTTSLVVLSGCGAQDNLPRPPDMGIHEAALRGNLEAIQQHIAAGSDLDVRDPSGGASPLITASAFGQTEVVKALIAGGADVNFTNAEGSTALHTAAFLCHPEIVRALLEADADKTLRNHAGATALESVTYPFSEVKAIYDLVAAALGPLGLQLDYRRLEATRPRIAEMLR